MPQKRCNVNRALNTASKNLAGHAIFMQGLITFLLKPTVYL